MNSIVLFSVLFFSTYAAFADSTCAQIKSSLSEMKEVDYAKSLGFGFHNCIDAIQVFNLDGTFSTSFATPSTVDTYYNETTGSIDSLYIGAFATNLIKEYADGKVILVSLRMVILLLMLKVKIKSLEAAVSRALGEYSVTKNKNLRAMQVYHVTPKGYILIRTELDDNENVSVVIVQTCTNA
jgi:hypothetical protein